MSKEIERRFIPFGSAEVRAARGEDGKVALRGMAAVTNTMSHLINGRFREQIAPGAFDNALKRSDIRGLFNHNPDMVLGRVKPGTMRVWADARGLHYDIPSLPDSRADVAEAVERGDVDGNSFSFIVAERGDKFEMRDGVRVRTITEFEEILDLGPVTFPAYEAAKVSKRALDMADALTDDEPVEKREEAPPEPKAPEPELPTFDAERILLAAAEGE